MMSEDKDRLSPEQNARILKDQVIPDFIPESVRSHERPRAIILGGQPGAGKGGLARDAQREMANDAVMVDPDELRRYHPDASRFRAENTYTWSSRTHADASAWSDGVLDYAISQRKNIVFDTTLSNGVWTSELINDLQVKGYEVEVRVVVAHKMESEIGVDERFARSVDEHGYGRYVPKAARDAIYDKIPQSLDVIYDKTDAPIRLITRDKEEVYDRRWSQERPAEVFVESRNGRMLQPEITQDMRERSAVMKVWNESYFDRVISESADSVSPHRPELEKLARDSMEESKFRASANAIVDEMVRPGAPPAITAVPSAEMAHLRRVGLMAGGTALGLAATAYEAHEAGERIQTLLQEKNVTAAKSEAVHFAAQGVGGWAGGTLAAIAVGSSGVGPMALIAADAYLFAKAFEKAATLRDNHTVYHQTDKAGTEWKYTGHSWVREAVLDRTHDGVDNPIKQQVSATYEKSRELNALANARAVELELGKVPSPKNPFSIPARAEDQRGLDNANWHRNPESGEWSRLVKTDVVGVNDRGTYTTEVASPERASQLDAEAVARVQENISNGREAVAAAYLQHRAEQRFSDFGAAVPPAVAHAQARPDAVFASDGHLYERNQDGQWRHGNEIAQGNLALELELTRQVRQPTMEQAAETLAQTEALPAPTRAEEERSELLHRYQNYNVRLADDWVPAIELANERTRQAHGVTGRTIQELQPDEKGLYTRDSAIVHYAVGEDGAARRVAVTTSEEVRQAYAELQSNQQDAPPIQRMSERSIDALTPEQAEAHEQALREANRQGMSAEDAGRAAMMAAAQVRDGGPGLRSDAAEVGVSASHAGRGSTESDGVVAAEAARPTSTSEEAESPVEPRHAWLNNDAPSAPAATRPEAEAPDHQTQQRDQELARAEQDRASQEPPAAPEIEPLAQEAQVPQSPTERPTTTQPTHGPDNTAAETQVAVANTHESGNLPPTQAQHTAPVILEGEPSPHNVDALAEPVASHAKNQAEQEVAQVPDYQDAYLAFQLPVYEAHPEETLPAPEQANSAEARMDPVPEPEHLEADDPSPSRLQPSDPAHPANALYRQVREQVEKLDQSLGRAYDDTSERLTGSLMVLAKENGLQRVDHVVLSDQVGDQRPGFNVFVVQGELGNPAHRRAVMPTEQAVTTPHEQSLERLDVLLEQNAQQEKQALLARQQDEGRINEEQGRAMMMSGGG